MQPIDPTESPKVHEPALNHVGLWVDDLAAAVAGSRARACASRRAASARAPPATTSASSIRRATRRPARRRGRADRAGAGAARGDRGARSGLVRSARARVSYAFGDSDRAAQRLALVARVFEPASREFLAEAGRRGGALAVDLGCGPGLHDRAARACARERALRRPRRVARLRRGRAARACPRAASSSVTTCSLAPYPTGRADTIYARFLVTHLADPAAAIGVFASQLAPRGRLLLDEVEWIHSDGRAVPALSRARRGRARVAAASACSSGRASAALRPAIRAGCARAACASSPSTRAMRPVCSR